MCRAVPSLDILAVKTNDSMRHNGRHLKYKAGTAYRFHALQRSLNIQTSKILHQVESPLFDQRCARRKQEIFTWPSTALELGMRTLTQYPHLALEPIPAKNSIPAPCHGK